MAKPFLSSVRCSHANDFDFRFCQRCGYKRKVLGSLPTTAPLEVDLMSIDDRSRQLTLFDNATSYAKQKDSLQKAPEKFLLSIPGSPTMATMTPRDICRFLMFKDKDGKTQVHSNGCNHFGKQGTFECGCPLRLSYKTVDSYIGKLPAFFHAIGRD